MLFVELVVIIIAELRAEKFKVGVTDDKGARLCREPTYGSIATDLACVLQCFVVTEETANAHTVESTLLFQHNIEVSYDEVGEIKSRKFEKQLILIDRIRRIHEQEREIDVAFGHELTRSDRVAVVKHYGAPFPHVAYVKLAAIQLAPGFHSVDYHSGQLAHVAFGIFAHYFLHVGKTSLAVAAVELAQSADKYELIAVCPHREARS